MRSNERSQDRRGDRNGVRGGAGAAALLSRAGLTTLAVALAVASPGGSVRASSGEATLEPSGRGLQLLGAREAILLDQTERARQLARGRARALYRILRTSPAPAAFGVAAADDSADGMSRAPRSVSLLARVLGRDLAEARLLRAELDRVRAERARLAVRAREVQNNADNADGEGNQEDDENAGPGSLASPRPGSRFVKAPTPRLQPPVPGELVVPFGVARDPATGAWSFRAAASYASGCGEPVSSPGDGRVVRVAESVAGGAGIVLVHGRAGWTTVVSHLRSVEVTRGDSVRKGERLGTTACDGEATVRIETWRGRTPVDPAWLLGR